MSDVAEVVGTIIGVALTLGMTIAILFIVGAVVVRTVRKILK